MRTKTWTDPIVEEIREVRRALVREAKGDLKELVARLMKSQQRHGRRLVECRGTAVGKTSARPARAPGSERTHSVLHGS